MSIETLEHKQKIVYVGLRRMTDDRNLIIDGFKYWMENHSSKTFDVEALVNNMVDYLGLGSGEKKALMIALHAASSKMPEDLPNVPQGLLDRATNKEHKKASNPESFDVEASDTIEKSLPPHCVVTAGYLQNLARALYKQHNDEFSDLKEILLEEEIEDISYPVKEAVKNWAEDGMSSIRLPESTTEAECKALSHGIYLFFTELVGPMDSDKLVNSALQQTLNLDEITRFHPRLLL